MEDEENRDMSDQRFLQSDPLQIEELASGDTQSLSFKAYLRSFEFAEFLICLSFLVVAIVIELAGAPRQRPLPYQQLESSGEFVVNQVFNEEFEGETVSSGALILYGMVVPFVAQMMLSRCVRHDSYHRTVCVYLAGLGLTVLLTNAIKLYAGYLRPVFFDICQPDDEYQACTSGEDNEARKSFPSGHASTSFCGFGLLSFDLERQFGLSSLSIWMHDPSTGHVYQTYKRPIKLARVMSILCYTPMVFAGHIASSRVVDNMHHPADVVGGAVLGVAIASLIHKIWYPIGPCDGEALSNQSVHRRERS